MSPLDVNRDLQWRRIATAGVLLCVVLVAATAFYPAWQLRRGAAPVSGYRVGQVIDLPAEVYQDRARTVVVFARSSCSASQRMKPLLTRLVDDLAEDPSSALVLVTPAVDAASERAFATEIGVAPGQHLARDLTTLKVVRVPTLVVVNQRGEVEFVHSGQPQTADEAAGLATALAAPRQER